jgi:hypothetical protein
MYKILITLLLSFSFLGLNAASFNIDESNSVNKVSLLTINNIQESYFRFNIDVMQRNNWDFRSDIYINSDNFSKKVKADFNGNTISFTLNNEEYLDLLNSEYLFVKSYLQYQDSFYMPDFRNSESYKQLQIESFKESFLEENK